MKLERDGFKVEWNQMLQEICDLDEPLNVEWIEIKIPHMKYSVCGNCKKEEYLHGEDGIRNIRCGYCGQRLDWE